MATTAPAPTSATSTIHFWRTLFATILLALVLKAGLHIPFLSTLLAVGVIFLTQMVLSRLGTRLATGLSWIRHAGRIVQGMVVFLALRFLAAKLFGIYPADTLAVNEGVGGVKEALRAHNMPSIILWEIMFAFVAGALVVAWSQKKSKVVGAIFAAALVILSIQLALPAYAATYPSRQEVDQHLAQRGFWRSLWDAMPWSPTATEKAATEERNRIKTRDLIERDTAIRVATIQAQEPLYVKDKTPASITADYEFNIEADAPVKVTYSDGQSMVYRPGMGCQQFPVPTWSDPKKFTDPRDEENGHVSFRLYRLRPGEGKCK